MEDSRREDENQQQDSSHVWRRVRDCSLPPGGTPYDELCGEDPSESGTFIALEVYKRVGKSAVLAC